MTSFSIITEKQRVVICFKGLDTERIADLSRALEAYCAAPVRVDYYDDTRLIINYSTAHAVGKKKPKEVYDAFIHGWLAEDDSGVLPLCNACGASAFGQYCPFCGEELDESVIVSEIVTAY